MKKKLLSVLMVFTVAASLAACSTPAQNQLNSTTQNPKDITEKQYKIGISQFAAHGSLDNCMEGFLKGLEEEGISQDKNLTVLFENAFANPGTAGQISNNFVSNNVDLICAIATPSAATAFTSAMDTEIPVIYTAITDPVEAGFANEDGTSTGNITGTSDKLPVEAQLQMIRKILPKAKTLGIMYTTSEPNSISAIKEYESLVEKYGFTLETVGISELADIPLAADNLITKVDCITNLTDNTVVQGLSTILEKAGSKGIPVFGSEVEQVQNGCLAAVGLDYVELGVITGKMAAKVLKEEAKASEMKFESITEFGLYLNNETAKTLNISIDEEYAKNALEIF